MARLTGRAIHLYLFLRNYKLPFRENGAQKKDTAAIPRANNTVMFNNYKKLISQILLLLSVYIVNYTPTHVEINSMVFSLFLSTFQKVVTVLLQSGKDLSKFLSTFCQNHSIFWKTHSTYQKTLLFFVKSKGVIKIPLLLFVKSRGIIKIPL